MNPNHHKVHTQEGSTTPEKQSKDKASIYKKLGAAVLLFSLGAGGGALIGSLEEAPRTTEVAAGYDYEIGETNDNTIEQANESLYDLENIDYYFYKENKESRLAFGPGAAHYVEGGLTTETTVDHLHERYQTDPALVAAHAADFGLISYKEVNDSIRLYSADADAWGNMAEQLKELQSESPASLQNVTPGYHSEYFVVGSDGQLEIRQALNVQRYGSKLVFATEQGNVELRVECGFQAIDDVDNPELPKVEDKDPSLDINVNAELPEQVQMGDTRTSSGSERSSDDVTRPGSESDNKKEQEEADQDSKNKKADDAKDNSNTRQDTVSDAPEVPNNTAVNSGRIDG